MILTFIIFSLCIKKINLLPSDEIWNKTMQYYDEGKMLIFDKNHFIFDEYNYTQLDINDTKMLDLYKKQDDLFFNYSISTFIFAVKYINETEECLNYTFKTNIKEKLKQFGANLNKTIFTVISIDIKRAIIYIGNKTQTEEISNRINSIENNLLEIISSEKYYEAWQYFLNEIIFYCVNEIDSFEFTDDTSLSPFPVDNIVNDNGKIILIIIILAIIIMTIIVFIIVYKCCKKKVSKSNNKNINESDTSKETNIHDNTGGNNTGDNIYKNSVDTNHK